VSGWEEGGSCGSGLGCCLCVFFGGQTKQKTRHTRHAHVCIIHINKREIFEASESKTSHNLLLSTNAKKKLNKSKRKPIHTRHREPASQ
jgi:hypothetical protein